MMTSAPDLRIDVSTSISVGFSSNDLEPIRGISFGRNLQAE
jgi:hypothetical protein